MASFYGTIDLLKLKGAKLLSGLDDKHPQMNWVCVPCVNYSGVEVRKHHNDDGFSATFPINLWPVSEKYRQAVIANKQSRGDDISNYNPPSHQVEVGYSQEFRQKAMDAAQKRILSEHPDWKDNPAHERELKNAVYDAVRVRLGNITARIDRSQQQSSWGNNYNSGYTQAPAATGAQQWNPPTVDDQGNEMPAYNPEDDDLPF